MSGVTNVVQWQKPTSDMPYVGQYFVAVKYPVDLGTYDIVEWDGQQWKLDYEGEIVGWVSMTEFMGSIKAGWPEWNEKKSNPQ